MGSSGPCWPDIWQHAKNLLPMFGVFASLLAYTALVILLLWAPKMHKRWLRVSARILGVAGVLPLVIALPVILFSLALVAGDPPAQTRVVESLDGQKAMLIYKAGFLGRDSTEVTLKSPGCCRHTIVFWHAGPSWFNDPKVEWFDNRHLRITYRTRPGDAQHCENRFGDITITCTSQPWPGTPSSFQASPGSR